MRVPDNNVNLVVCRCGAREREREVDTTRTGVDQEAALRQAEGLHRIRWASTRDCPAFPCVSFPPLLSPRPPLGADCVRPPRRVQQSPL